MDKDFYIITPSFNQGKYLEETLDSVISQRGNFKLKYIVIDGGSSDETVDILKRHSRHLHYWVSEPDRGQTHAINKGLAHITSGYWGYINSDDFYVAGALQEAYEVMISTGTDWVTGSATYISADGAPVRTVTPTTGWTRAEVLGHLITDPIVVAMQASNFMSHRALKQFGPFREDLHYCFDVEFGLRQLISDIRPVVINKVLACARLHPESKTVSVGHQKFPQETAAILNDILLNKEYAESLTEEEYSAIHRALADYLLENQFSTLEAALSHAPPLRAALLWTQFVSKKPKHFLQRRSLGLLRRALAGLCRR